MGDDKCAIKATVIQSLSGKTLPFQIIYTAKIETCLPKNATVKEHFLFSYNEKHWSNEVETLSLIDMIIAPYIENVKKELQAPNDQESFLIWDAFKGQSTPRVHERLAELGVVVVTVPKKMRRLLELLDDTTNGTIKKMKKSNSVIILPP